MVTENREENRALVAFTWMAPLSVGGSLGLLAIRDMSLEVDPNWIDAIPFGIGVLALGASMLHLGRPLRAYRAMARLSTSWLSREVMLFGLFLFFLALCSLPPLAILPDGVRSFAGLLAAAIGFLALVATGRLYHLPSRPAWHHWTAAISFPLGALSAGLLLGVAVAQLNGSAAPAGNGVFLVASVALFFAMVVTWFRSSRLQGGTGEELASWKLLAGRYRWALILRIAGSLGALLLIYPVGWSGAWIPAALGELGDRVLFFYGVVPVSFAVRSGVPAWTSSTSKRNVGPPWR